MRDRVHGDKVFMVRFQYLTKYILILKKKILMMLCNYAP